MERNTPKRNRFRRWCAYLKRYSKEFCEMSSIQGLSYVVKDVSIVERIWWIVVMILSFWASCYMVFKITDKWLTTPVLVSLATREMHIKDIPFPAVTICPESKVSHTCLNYTEILLARRRNDLDSLIENVEKYIYFDLMAVLCREENHMGTMELMQNAFKSEFNFSDFSGEEVDGGKKDGEIQLDDYSPFFKTCTTVDLDLSYCSWMGKMVKCKDVLTEIVTDEGLCYSFNMYDLRDLYSEENEMEYLGSGNRREDWHPETGYIDTEENFENHYPRRAFLSGSKNAFVAVFLTNKNDIEYACRDFSIQGMRVSIHSPTNIPRMAQVFFSVGLDRLTTVAVNPALSQTSDNLLTYDPKKRNCFFGYERRLKFFQYYSQDNCNLECFTNYTAAHCGCVSFFMPRDNETAVCTLKKRFCLEYARLNYTQDILRERLKSFSANYTGKTTNCNCLPLCSEITYNAEIATSNWRFDHPEEVEFDEYRENLTNYRASAVKVFFKNSYFLPTQRDELYGISDMISNIGGALGLITGFSLYSLAEIVYFLTVKLIDNHRLHGLWMGPPTPKPEDEPHNEELEVELQDVVKNCENGCCSKGDEIENLKY